MLTGLKLRNFKTWRDTGRINLSPVTAFFGSNSSGKTSILQSLLMLRQTVEDPDRNQTLALNGLVDLGTYEDVVFGHRRDLPLSIYLKWTSREHVEVIDFAAQVRKKQSLILSSSDLSLETEINLSSKSPNVRQMTYTVGDTNGDVGAVSGITFGMVRTGDAKDRYKYELDSNAYEFKRNQGRVWLLPDPVKCYGFPPQARARYQNASILSDIEFRFEEICETIRYLGPLRNDPQREYTITGSAPRDVGKRGELAINALVAARDSDRMISRGWTRGSKRRRLTKKLPMESVIGAWLSELGLISSFDLRKLDERGTLYRMNVKLRSNSAPVLLTDVGFGVSQVLPVLVMLAYAQDGDTLVLEQPEIHLHPAVQSGLADIILETALTRNVQIIFESHSEHLLMRLQRRIAEVEFGHNLSVKPSDVSLYFCRQTAKGSSIEELDLDLFGNITNWPAEFFGDPLADRIAMLDASKRRKRAGEE
jgi:predicted ATPase